MTAPWSPGKPAGHRRAAAGELGSCVASRWVSSISSRRAWCQSRLQLALLRASSSVQVEHLFEKVDPEDGLHRSVGTAVVRAVHRSKALLVNQGERLVPENLGPTPLQAPGLLRRNQELGLPQAHLWVSLSEHAHLPRPGAAPRRFPTLSLPCPSLARGFYERIILEATDEDLNQLIPYLERASIREPERYRLTDPGVMTLAARLYRFRPNFRKQAASVLGEMAVGSHTGEWSRALGECGDDTGELTEAFVRVAEREMLDLAGPLSDLGHVNEVTRALWSRRLQFVSDHPLGKRSGSAIGPRYDVPAEFLRELGSTASLQYVDKLVEIGSDDGQPVLNRAAALAAAANVVDLLSTSDREQVFRRVRPLAEQPIQISEMDEYNASTQRPLSRFRMSLGSATNVRTSAGLFLGRAATGRDECSVAMEIALDWVRSDDSVLQDTGAAILGLPNVSSCGSHSTELAKHKNPSVRCAAVWMPDMQECPETATFERLAADPDRKVRVAVTQALRSTECMDSDSYGRIRQRLNDDQSAIVRACASELRKS